MPSSSSTGAVVVIPARLESRRFPRKVLARQTGKFLIEHVYEGVQGSPGVTRAIIATDDREVYEAARSFGADVWMTSPEHLSGTDRVAEVARQLEEETVINVQGDEPSIRRDDIGRLADAMAGCGAHRQETDADHRCDMATLARKRDDAEGFADPNLVKVVTDGRDRALYFSRAPIPGRPSSSSESAVEPWLQHIGIYAYRREFLQTFTRLAPGKLEKRERLEQLRALENGYSIRVLLTEHDYAGIDTEEEYRAFVARVRDAEI